MWGQGRYIFATERRKGTGIRSPPGSRADKPLGQKTEQGPPARTGPGTEGAAAPQPGSPAPTGSEPRWPWLSGLRGRPFRGPTEPEEGEGLNLLPSAVPLP